MGKKVTLFQALTIIILGLHIRLASAEPRPNAEVVQERILTALQEARSLSAQCDSIDGDLDHLVRRAVFPGEPGTVGPPPTPSEFEAIESRAQAFKLEAETFLQILHGPGLSTLEYEALSLPQQSLVNCTLNFTLKTHLAKISTTLPFTEQEWIDSSMLIPARLAQTLSKNLAGSDVSPLELDDSVGALVSVRISRDFLIGQEIGTLAQSRASAPKEQALLRFAQLQTSLQTVENLARIRDLLGPEVRLPNIAPLPAPLRRISRRLADPNRLLLKKLSALRESRYRKALGSTLAEHSPALFPQSAINPELAQSIIAIQTRTPGRGPRTPEQRATAAQALLELAQRVEARERVELPESLASQLDSLTSTLENQSVAKKLSLLRPILAQLQTASLYNTLTALAGRGSLNLSESGFEAVAELVKNRQAELVHSYDPSALQAWLEASDQTAEQARLESRHEWIHSTYSTARLYTSAAQPPTPRALDPLVALATLSSTEPSLRSALDSLRSAVLSRLDAHLPSAHQTATDPLWAVIHEGYLETLGEFATPSPLLVSDRPLNFPLISAFIEAHQFRPDRSAYPGMPTGVADRLRNRVGEERKARARALIEVGRRFGFGRSAAHPTLEQLFPAERDRAAYQQSRLELSASQFPFLELSLIAHSPGVGAYPARLADVVARQSHLEALDANGTATVWKVLEPALRQLDQEIRTRNDRILSGENWQELEAFAKTLVRLRLSLDREGSFATTTAHLAERLATPSLVDALFERYLNVYVAHGGVAVIAIQLTNWGARKVFRRYGPIGAVFSELLIDPLVQGFMRPLLVLGVAHTAYLGHQAHDAAAFADEADSALRTDLIGQRQLSRLSVLGLRSQAQQAELSFYMGAAGDALCVFIPYVAWPLLKPILSPLLEPVLSRVVQWAGTVTQARAARIIEEDLRAFERLSLPPGEFSGVPEALRQLRATPGLSAEIRGEIEQAGAHLLGKIRDGETWSISRALEPSDDIIDGLEELTTAERRLRRAMGLPSTPRRRPST